MHTPNPILDTNQLPVSSMPEAKISKQSVILNGVNSLTTRVNNFSRTSMFVMGAMALTILANFGTSIAAVLYLKDMYIDDNSNMLVNSMDEPIGTSMAMDVHEFASFPTYEDVLQKIAGGMAVYNGTAITRVEQGVVQTGGDVLLYGANGEHIGSAIVEDVESIPTFRHLEANAVPTQKMSFVNSVTGGSRLCKDPNKACYDVWKRKCIPCSGEYRGIKQNDGTNVVNGGSADSSCWTSAHCPPGWGCDTAAKKCVEMTN